MKHQEIDLVDQLRFLQATRDSGYRNVASALSELVDNSIQAGARQIDIDVRSGQEDGTQPYISILDDGSGMSSQVLSHALQFGGSDRFDDRSGMGRFGMGLPNSSLSQARRVDVYTWSTPGDILHTYLDLTEILTTTNTYVPAPESKNLPAEFRERAPYSGTLVIWSDLDRLRPGNWKALDVRLERRLGQVFRYFLWNGCTISINGKVVTPFDPLYLSQQTRTPLVQAIQYGHTLSYPIALTNQIKSTVEVRFAELPVCDLAQLTNQNKRLSGIVNGAGVSIVRARREIDYGWFFMDKRRENYDDWWRCEIRFEPDLDEVFGVTHIKQGIRPTDAIRSIMTAELGNIARILNRRVRLAHLELAAQNGLWAAANIAAQKDELLRPLPVAPSQSLKPAMTDGQRLYCLVMEKIDARVFLQTRFQDGHVTVILNTMHEFFRDVYEPLLRNRSREDERTRQQLELMLFALGRTLHLERDEESRAVIQAFMADWSRAIAVFCGRPVR
jgi:hypothetical protein